MKRLKKFLGYTIIFTVMAAGLNNSAKPDIETYLISTAIVVALMWAAVGGIVLVGTLIKD